MTHWVGICDVLALTVESETWAELMEDIALILDAMFQDLLAGNELDPFLRDRGWTAQVPDVGPRRRGGRAFRHPVHSRAGAAG